MVGAAVTRRVLAFFNGPTSVLLSICMHVLAPKRRKREGKSGATVGKYIDNAVMPEALYIK
jgi:hypothetical protein